MVVWHLAEEVVCHMGVSDVVVEVVQDAIGAVHSGQGTPQPVPLLAIVVGQRLVGVLQLRDHHQPVVDDEVGDAVDACQPAPAVSGAGAPQGAPNHCQRHVTDQHLDALAFAEDGGVRVKVVGPAAVGAARDIDHQIGGPAKHQRDKQSRHPPPPVLVDVDVRLRPLLHRRHKHLVLFEAPGVAMVPPVGVLPGVIRHQQACVHKQTHSVVYRLILRERLVAALVGNDPQAGTDCALQEPVRRPQQAPPHRSRHSRVAEPGGCIVQRCRCRQVCAEICEGRLQGPLEAVCRDGLAQCANGEGWCGRRLPLHGCLGGLHCHGCAGGPVPESVLKLPQPIRPGWRIDLRADIF
mmetsp:Transcript_18937/g.57203  ORF Transcript_18937/g.57203 Transcript_18937/m.57203 type:complete len:351 (-) Transcript_18937:144-1196(-)